MRRNATPPAGAETPEEGAHRPWLALTARFRGSRAVFWRFLILYPLCVLALAGVMTTQFVKNRIDAPLNTLTAHGGARVLGMLGYVSSANGADLTYDNRMVSVKTGCSGLELLAILVPAILVFPSSLRAKLVGVLAAVAFVVPLNTIRVASLCILLARSQESFNMAHVYFWQAGLVGCLFGFFVAWMRWVVSWPLPRRS